MAEQIGYNKTNIVTTSLSVGDSIEVSAPDCGMLMIDAGLGGSEYIYLKRYSDIHLVGSTESENFKATAEWVSRNVIKITSVGQASASIRYKYIDFE